MSKRPLPTLKLKVSKLGSLPMYILLKKFHSCFISSNSWSLHQMLLSIRRPSKVYPSPHRFWTNRREKKGVQIETKLFFLLLIEDVTLHLLAPDMWRFILCPPLLTCWSSVMPAMPISTGEENLLPARTLLLRLRRRKLDYACSVYSS